MKRILTLMMVALLLMTQVAFAEEWTCPNCNTEGLTSAFCPNCGNKKPDTSWTCPNCNTEGLESAFCPECGTARTAAQNETPDAPAEEDPNEKAYAALEVTDTGIASVDASTNGIINKNIKNKHLPEDDTTYLNFYISLKNTSDEEIRYHMAIHVVKPDETVVNYDINFDQGHEAGETYIIRSSGLRGKIDMLGKYQVTWTIGEHVLQEKTFVVFEELTSKDPHFTIDYYRWSLMTDNGNQAANAGVIATQTAEGSDGYISPCIKYTNCTEEPVEINSITLDVKMPDGSSYNTRNRYTGFQLAPGKSGWKFLDEQSARKSFSAPGDYVVTWLINGNEILTETLTLLPSTISMEELTGKWHGMVKEMGINLTFTIAADGTGSYTFEQNGYEESGDIVLNQEGNAFSLVIPEENNPFSFEKCEGTYSYANNVLTLNIASSMLDGRVFSYSVDCTRAD